MIECFFDGCVWPHNPGGHGGYGMLIRRNHQTIHTEAGYIGHWHELSNNVAEYAGCISVLRYLIRENVAEAIVYGDADMVIRQLNGKWRAKNGAYIPYYLEAYALRVQLPNVKLEWIPREMNAGADDLSKIAARKRVISFCLDSSITHVAPPIIPKRKRSRDMREAPLPNFGEDEAWEIFKLRYGHI